MLLTIDKISNHQTLGTLFVCFLILTRNNYYPSVIGRGEEVLPFWARPLGGTEILEAEGMLLNFYQVFGKLFLLKLMNSFHSIYHPSLVFQVLKLRQIHWYNPTLFFPKTSDTTLHSREQVEQIRNGESNPRHGFRVITPPGTQMLP